MKFKPTGQLRTEQIRHLGVNVNSPYGGRMNQIIICKSHIKLKNIKGEFPGGPPVRTSPSHAGGAGSIPGRGVKIPHASRS